MKVRILTPPRGSWASFGRHYVPNAHHAQLVAFLREEKLQRRVAPTLTAITGTGGRNDSEWMAELSGIRTRNRAEWIDP